MRRGPGPAPAGRRLIEGPASNGHILETAELHNQSEALVQLENNDGWRLRIANPIYAEIVPRELTRAVQETLPQEAADGGCCIQQVTPTGRLCMGLRNRLYATTWGDCEEFDQGGNSGTAVYVRACRRTGRLVATSPDIRGLVLEVDSVDELQTELLRISEHLLRTNHGLTDAQIAEVQLNVTLQSENDDPPSPAPARPRILFDDQRAAQAVAA